MSVIVRVILPFACAWAQRQESTVLEMGVPLSPTHINTARRLGILYPERIRLRAVSRVPPLNWLLRRVGERVGVVSGQTIGMALRYGILIREEHWAIVDCSSTSWRTWLNTSASADSADS